MSDKIIKIDKSSWRDNFDQILAAYRVIAPRQQEDGSYEFQRLATGQTPDLDMVNTRLSPKFVMFPQTEVMLNFSTDPRDPDCNLMKEPDLDPPPTAVVGLRPCDARAMTLVKLNFDTPEYQDPYWLKKYEAAVFVGLACDQPLSTCFCTATGGGPYNEEGLDVLLVDRGDFWLARVLTEKGQAFVATAGWDEAAGEAEDFAAGKNAAEEKIAAAVPTDRLAGQDLLELYEAPFWDEIAFACINCGTCTYLCPTCWCFDIQDENYGKNGVRLRIWDSCMYPLFTKHTTGHNPRGEKTQRVRQRFMHKLKYFVDKYEQGVMCTGCGRCVRQCPVNIDIRSVCERMNNYQPAPQSAQAGETT
ncbi:MAG: 4Fe-4S dicluster domain-containing protein [Desulfosudaceae bacterium]